MKKILSIIAIFSLLFLSFGNIVSASSSNNLHNQASRLNMQSDLNFTIKFNTKDPNHLLANILILSKLQSEWYNINNLYNTINNFYGGRLSWILNKINNSLDNWKIKESIELISEILWWERPDPNWLLWDFWVNIRDWRWNDKYNFWNFNPLNNWGWVGNFWVFWRWGLWNWFWWNTGWNAMAWWTEAWDVYAKSTTRKESHNWQTTIDYTHESYQNDGEWEEHYSFKHATRNADWTVNWSSYVVHKHSDWTTEVSSSTWTTKNWKTTKKTTYTKYDKDGNVVKSNTTTTKWMWMPDAPWNEGKDWGNIVQLPWTVKVIFEKINSKFWKNIVLWKIWWNVGNPWESPKDREDWGNDWWDKPIWVIWWDDVTNWWINWKPIHTTYKWTKPTRNNSNINWWNWDWKSSFNANLQTKWLNPQKQNPWENQNWTNLWKSNSWLQQQNLWLTWVSNKISKSLDDWIQRKYAKTRFPRCSENDIIIWNQVWAACNETKKISQAYWPYWKATDKDEHWWTYWLLYNREARSKLCWDWYRLPTPNELKKLWKIKNVFNILKLTNKYFDHKFYSWYHHYYYSNDSSNDWLAIDLESWRPIHIYFYKRWYPVRCIRNTPATAEELWQGSNSNEQNWNNNQTNNSQGDLTSNDEYVNEKLNEINECFLNTYNSHLKNIDDTIRKFRDTMNKSNDEKTKKKYEKAIKKLEEIKRLFIKKYKFILDYKK